MMDIKITNLVANHFLKHLPNLKKHIYANHKDDINEIPINVKDKSISNANSLVANADR